MPSRSDLKPPMGRMVLASASPRRQELLEAAGIEFDVLPSAVKEQQRANETAGRFVRRIATEKALEVLKRMAAQPPRPVLGADTVVVVDGRTLGKPASPSEAARMLRLLAGKQHRVLTGVCLAYPIPSTPTKAEKLRKDVRVASTTVRFAPLSEKEIIEYVATGEPMDKAGAYGIQGRASKFVERIDGCYSNVVGLPLSLVYQMLKDLQRALQERRVTRVATARKKGRPTTLLLRKGR